MANARLAQLAEHYLDTVGVTSSSLVPRTSLRLERSVKRRLPRRSAIAKAGGWVTNEVLQATDGRPHSLSSAAIQ